MSSNPPRFPAIEKLWQGKPPQIRSISGSAFGLISRASLNTILLSYHILPRMSLWLFIYFAKADALKSADIIKSRSKTTNSGKHIKIFDAHKASALYLLLSPHILITGPSDCSSARSSVVSSTHIAFCSCSISCSVSFLKLSSFGTRANVLPLSQFI